MAGGRPNKGIGHLDKLDTDRDTKNRAKAIILTLQGELSVKEAAESLAISESRFHELRDEFLEGGAKRLEPRMKGRPANEEDPKDHEIEVLKNRIKELEIDVHTSRIREEIALTMPHVLERKTIAAQEKTDAQKKREKRKKEKKKQQVKKKMRRIRKKK
jgi:hypothetical protein